MANDSSKKPDDEPQRPLSFYSGTPEAKHTNPVAASATKPPLTDVQNHRADMNALYLEQAAFGTVPDAKPTPDLACRIAEDPAAWQELVEARRKLASSAQQRKDEGKGGSSR